MKLELRRRLPFPPGGYPFDFGPAWDWERDLRGWHFDIRTGAHSCFSVALWRAM